MKKQILLFFAVIFLSSQGFSQFKLGVKGGLNYNFAGNITEAGSSNVFSSENKAGFHLGLWSRFSIVGFGLRPEIVYTELKSQYQLSSRTTLKTKKIDIPVLFDKKLGPLHLFAGPAFQLILNSDFKSSDIGAVDYNKFTLGTQIGLGLEFANLGVDARWEKGFSNNLTGVLISSSTNLNLDNRPNQIILSVYYNLL
ncbi:MAG: hypothetical protein CO023_01105 [Flavobacteriales bacterium CG_4_9_14_0_2_um_filter_35_242]|nr:PorT family protein [Zetaproteobacteria bacterium]OIO11361.1 MAG: hypothetical protein AUJ53_05140 [Flavobacteriaceae bacterium CG1_02_35_72]PJA04553.1 MAG: hypothetical protein COX71_11290 [Flavobacteriales bacterium CG_4_10_14_0_2_um_filter_35_18]PJC60441.1 MAG: hypothetical protein CO023_01105 [Flavobacteriales bacterium CG_4_9_14_0_2_um_filter_35_242]